MILVGISMVKNEQDIIEFFVRENLRYLDALHIIEHDSFDATKEILLDLKNEGLPITIYYENYVGFVQEKQLNDLLCRVLKNCKPDYVFPLDADEILVAPN